LVIRVAKNYPSSLIFSTYSTNYFLKHYKIREKLANLIKIDIHNILNNIAFYRFYKDYRPLKIDTKEKLANFLKNC